MKSYPRVAASMPGRRSSLLIAALIAAGLSACNSGSSPAPAPVPEPDPVVAPNQAPTAAILTSNTGLTLSVDGAGSSDADGSVASWHWSFGEPSSPTDTAVGATATHTYSAAGTYQLTLTVTDDKGLTTTLQRAIAVAPANLAPMPAFTVTPSGLSVMVADAASSDPDGTIVSFAWNFGEPSSGTNTATGPSASHSYTVPGTYPVTLTVTDNLGLVATRVQDVTVSGVLNAAPTASFTLDASNQPVADVNAAASSDSDGTIASYAWDFGDPASGSANAAAGATSAHTYASTGTYTVSLTVTDDQGATNTTTNNVSITSTTVVGSGNLQFRLDWSRGGDLDVVVATPGGKTISYQNTGPNANTEGGQLDADSGTVGPENVYWASADTPPSGTFHACAETYDFTPPASPVNPVTVTLTIRQPSAAPQVVTRTLTATTSNSYACSPASDSYMGSVTLP